MAEGTADFEIEWQWNVRERFSIAGRGVVIVGGHSGRMPEVGESVTVAFGKNAVDAVVVGIEIGQQLNEDGTRGQFLGICLGGITKEAVPVGGVVLPRQSRN